MTGERSVGRGARPGRGQGSGEQPCSLLSEKGREGCRSTAGIGGAGASGGGTTSLSSEEERRPSLMAGRRRGRSQLFRLLTWHLATSANAKPDVVLLLRRQLSV